MYDIHIEKEIDSIPKWESGVGHSSLKPKSATEELLLPGPTQRRLLEPPGDGQLWRLRHTAAGDLCDGHWTELHSGCCTKLHAHLHANPGGEYLHTGL